MPGADRKLFESGSAKDPNEGQSRDPMKNGKPGSFATPLDIVKQRMSEAAMQSAGSKSKGASQGEEKCHVHPGNLASESTREEDTLGREERAGAGKRSIQYLEVHREKVAELRALKELTFDDVQAWSAESSEGVSSEVKAMMAAELQLKKLQLISAYHDLQLVPMRKLFAWAVPTEEALETIKEYSPKGVVEVGAGTGYWAALLEERGVSVRAFDRDPVHMRHNGHHSPIMQEQLDALGKGIEYRVIELDMDPNLVRELSFGWVDEGGPDTAGRYPERSLLLCWPPDETDEASPDDVKSMGVDALNAYKGSTLLYVGEPFNIKSTSLKDERISKTAGPRFEQSLRAGGWVLQKEVYLPNWPECSDRLQIWKREGVESFTNDPGAQGADGKTVTDDDASTSEGLEGKLERGDHLLEGDNGLKERLSGQTQHASYVKGSEGEGRKEDIGALEQGSRDVVKAATEIETVRVKDLQRASTGAGKEEREMYINALRIIWDAVASELIVRRVKMEWEVRQVHAPLAQIEEETNARHMSRQSWIQRILMQFASKIVKGKEDTA